MNLLRRNFNISKKLLLILMHFSSVHCCQVTMQLYFHSINIVCLAVDIYHPVRIDQHVCNYNLIYSIVQVSGDGEEENLDTQWQQSTCDVIFCHF